MKIGTLAHCIGCGCTDQQACYDEKWDGPCRWLVVDREQGLGVCSSCEEHLERWQADDREIAVPTGWEEVSER